MVLGCPFEQALHTKLKQTHTHTEGAHGHFLRLIYRGLESDIIRSGGVGMVVEAFTVSLTVIIIECTNEITFALPIMLTLLISTRVF